MVVSRRSVLATVGKAVVAVTACAGAWPAQARAATPGAGPAAKGRSSKLILLGTGGGPVLGGERGMAANVIVVGESAYVVDCGYGAAGALARAGVALRQIDGLFITHNHADHMMDYGAILFFAWLQGRTKALEVYGPAPLQDITTHLLAANATPLSYYKEDMGMAPMPDVRVHEIGAALVMSDENVRVTCATVHHPPVVPALAYRFDLADRSIVFSGDTSPSENLIRLAKDADILVHEAMNAEITMAVTGKSGGGSNGPNNAGATPGGFDAEKFREHVYNAHTSAEDAGKVAASARVKTLVLNHLSPGASALMSDGAWIAAARTHFSGQIIVAHDGMTL